MLPETTGYASTSGKFSRARSLKSSKSHCAARQIRRSSRLLELREGQHSNVFPKRNGGLGARVQLCTDLTRMPVEDASVEWDEHLSPSLTIARVTVQPQNAYSNPRRVWVDEQLSFNPWHSLAAHRPLGNIMRARFKAYQASSHFRHSAEGRQMVEPRSIEEMPD
jgi:hypothetical protein